MSFRLPKAAGVVALACAASALSLPLAAPARAVTAPVEKMFLAADTDTDTFAGLSTRLTPTSTPTTVVPDSGFLHIRDLASSEDGSRVIYVQENYSPVTDNAVSMQLVVRDVSTRVVRVLMTQPWDETHFISKAAISPDGSNAVWEMYNADLNTISLLKSGVGSGKPTTLKTGLSPYAFLDATTVLVQDIAGNASTIKLDGTVGTITGVPDEALDVAVSPDRTHVAWGLFDTTVPDGQPLVAPMQVATLTSGPGGFTVGTPTTLTGSTEFNSEPSFSRDSTKVYWVHSAGDFDSPSDIWSGPVDNGTAAAATAATSQDEQDVAIVATDDGTAPAAIPTVGAATLLGSKAALSWTLPADGDLSGTVVFRKVDGVQDRNPVYVPAPTTTLTDTGLTLGTNYQFTFAAVDRSNHYSTVSAPLNLTAMQALPTAPSPTTNASATRTFPVTFGPAGPGAGHYAVQYNTGGGPWTPWLSNATTRSASFTGTAGASYTFSARGFDSFGNSTPWVNTSRIVVPFDQTKATYTGGGNAYTSLAYLGSYRKLWHSTDVARVTLTGSVLQVVGATCGTCGVFDVYDNGHWIGSANTYGSVTRLRRVLFTKSFSGMTSHSFAIKPRATAGHPDVKLDGFAMRT
jgi:hypothetical protein